MHMRHKKWARPELSVCPYFEDAPVERSGHWRERFLPDRPLHVELGCGKGVSTAGMVRSNPDINYVVIDITCDILGDARRNIQNAFGENTPDNVVIVRYDVEYINRLFSRGDAVDRIIINFCNPWTERPKYAKRRLTHPRQLLQYRSFLRDSGEISVYRRESGDRMLRQHLYRHRKNGHIPRLARLRGRNEKLLPRRRGKGRR